MLPAIITDHKSEIDRLCREHHVRRLELFGSAVTGDWDAECSDLDLLVSFRQEIQWKEVNAFERALKQLFARDIDLVREREFKNPYFRQSLEASRTYLWGEAREAVETNGVSVTTNRTLGYPVGHSTGDRVPAGCD